LEVDGIVGRPDRPEERTGLPVAAHEQVLAVVDLATGDLVVKRARAAAAGLGRLEHEDLAPGFGDSHRGRQPGEAASNDDRSWLAAGHRSGAGYSGETRSRGPNTWRRSQSVCLPELSLSRRGARAHQARAPRAPRRPSGARGSR